MERIKEAGHVENGFATLSADGVKTGLQELNNLAQDRKWKLITRQALDTNGHWSRGS